METARKPCRLCTELEEALAAAEQPDAPDLLLGLTAAGHRNRTHQREEKIARLRLALEKHQKAFHKVEIEAGG